MAKRLDSPYEPGRRSGAWIKVKNHAVPGRGRGRLARRARGGARTASARSPSGSTTRTAALYAGKVGTGFTEETLASTMRS